MADRFDDDWTGEPPEGRHPPGTARPEFWRKQRPPLIAGIGIALAVAVAVLVLLLR